MSFGQTSRVVSFLLFMEGLISVLKTHKGSRTTIKYQIQGHLRMTVMPENQYGVPVFSPVFFVCCLCFASS